MKPNFKIIGGTVVVNLLMFAGVLIALHQLKYLNFNKAVQNATSEPAVPPTNNKEEDPSTRTSQTVIVKNPDGTCSCTDDYGKPYIINKDIDGNIFIGKYFNALEENVTFQPAGRIVANFSGFVLIKRTDGYDLYVIGTRTASTVQQIATTKKPLDFFAANSRVSSVLRGNTIVTCIVKSDGTLFFDDMTKVERDGSKLTVTSSSVALAYVDFHIGILMEAAFA